MLYFSFTLSDNYFSMDTPTLYIVNLVYVNCITLDTPSLYIVNLVYVNCITTITVWGNQ